MIQTRDLGPWANHGVRPAPYVFLFFVPLCFSVLLTFSFLNSCRDFHEDDRINILLTMDSRFCGNDKKGMFIRAIRLLLVSFVI